MGTMYEQLSLSERDVIARLLCEGRSLREIGRLLCRSASTISREVRRNSKPTKAWPGGYDGKRAAALAGRRRRRGRAHKLARQPALRALVRDCLAMGWSPEQIAGRLAQEHAPMRISHESIYRFIYHRTAQKDYWHRLLPRGKLRRGFRGRKGGSSASYIRRRTPVHERPEAADARREPGHWEADLMLFATYGQAVLVLHERMTRYTVITRQPSKAADPTADTLCRHLAALPTGCRRSVTFDNGSEFARHWRLTDRLGVDTYFCDPHAPWQKGGIENAIGRLRRPLPRKADLAKINRKDLDRLAHSFNNTPRKCLGFKTPSEAFNQIKNRVALET